MPANTLLLRIFFLISVLFLSRQGNCFSNPEDSLRSMLKQTLHDTARIKIYNDLSKLYERNEMKKAIAFADTAIYLSEKADYLPGRGIALIHKALAHRYLGEFDVALELNQEALALFDELNDIRLAAGIHINIGVLFWMTGNLDQAREHYLQALATMKVLQDYPGLGSLYTNLGILSAIESDYVEAEKYFLLSLENYRLGNDANGEARAFDNLGQIFIDQGDFDKALDYNSQCYALYSKLGDNYGMALALDVKSTIFSKKGQYAEALAVLDEARLIADQGDILEIKANIADSRYKVYEKMKNFEKALFYYKEKQMMLDTIAQRANEDKLQELEAIYENEKKEQEIEILNKDKALSDLRLLEKNAVIERDQVYKYALLAGLGLILVVAGIAIYSFITKRRDNIIIHNQKKEVELQHHRLAEVHKEVKDSINYAEKIQRALLTGNDEWLHIGQKYMILFKPKDVVSGDFYWAYHDKRTNRSIWVVADCTGHGVPGAFMSMLGISFLNEIIIDSGRTEPSAVLDMLRQKIVKALEQKNESKQRRDGMDVTICIWDKNKQVLSYAGANNPLWIVSKNQHLGVNVKTSVNSSGTLFMHELSPDKQPVGFHTSDFKPFSQVDVKLSPGDIIYSFTDGFADQFGGEKGKKFKYTRLKEKLVDVYDKPLERQAEILDKIIRDWRGELEQVDDICGVGIQV